MSEAATVTAAGYSLGERLYEALRPAGLRFAECDPDVQALYDRAAVTFVSRLTYTESAGVREALLSSVLLEALKLAEGFTAGFEGDPGQESVGAILKGVRAAIAQAEATYPTTLATKRNHE